MQLDVANVSANFVSSYNQGDRRNQKEGSNNYNGGYNGGTWNGGRGKGRGRGRWNNHNRPIYKVCAFKTINNKLEVDIATFIAKLRIKLNFQVKTPLHNMPVFFKIPHTMPLLRWFAIRHGKPSSYVEHNRARESIKSTSPTGKSSLYVEHDDHLAMFALLNFHKTSSSFGDDAASVSELEFCYVKEDDDEDQA
ncbi:hypothetical protein Dsin_001354 [Dipteronia sinensis]|uniref:Uncharacterized protein n=1 Tax=Dipteronia sinensis TaxID=43782 RepID=A0AAE0B4L2_9ROSI|nr:hypothetical protein Dsin_001354 [Dipteronia sinensis]